MRLRILRRGLNWSIGNCARWRSCARGISVQWYGDGDERSRNGRRDWSGRCRSSACRRTADWLSRVRSGRRGSLVCWSRAGWVTLRRLLGISTQAIRFLDRRIDYGQHVNLRRIGGGVRNILGNRHFVFVAGTAKIFMRHRSLDRGDRLRVQPAVKRLLTVRPECPHLRMPGGLRSGKNRAGGKKNSADDCALQTGARPRCIFGISGPSLDVGEEFRFALLFVLLRLLWLLLRFGLLLPRRSLVGLGFRSTGARRVVGRRRRLCRG